MLLTSAHQVFTVLACICFFLAFVNRPISNPGFNMGWLGMLLLTIGSMIGTR